MNTVVPNISNGVCVFLHIKFHVQGLKSLFKSNTENYCKQFVLTFLAIHGNKCLSLMLSFFGCYNVVSMSIINIKKKLFTQKYRFCHHSLLMSYQTRLTVFPLYHTDAHVLWKVLCVLFIIELQKEQKAP